MAKPTIEYDLRVFENPDGSFAVRVMATAFLDGNPVRHPQKDAEGNDLEEDKLRPVFFEVEVSSPEGPKEGESLEDWGLRYAKERGVKAELDAQVERQLVNLGLIERRSVEVKKARI